MENLPILNYRDLAQLWQYSSWDLFDGSIADDASLEVMLRIEKAMQRLKVMGDDNRRCVWIRLKAPHRKADRYGDADEKDYYWAQLLTANYKDFHYLLLEDPEASRYFDLRSAKNTSAKREESTGVDVKDALLKLEVYVDALIDSICENSDNYNQYVAEHLPYSLREGKIKRSVLNKIILDMAMFKNRERAVEVLSLHLNTPIWYSCKMTLRIYMHVWRIAYDSYKMNNLDWRAYDSDTLSDEEVFISHNSKGSEVKGLDWDSEEDFIRWEDANSTYHCNDVAYARISLCARNKKEYYDDVDVPDGNWFFTLGYGVAGYSDDMIAILDGLLDKGINVLSHDTDRLLRMAEETDYVGITPNPNKYANDDTIGNEIRLPYEHRQEIIAATEWGSPTASPTNSRLISKSSKATENQSKGEGLKE